VSSEAASAASALAKEDLRIFCALDKAGRAPFEQIPYESPGARPIASPPDRRCDPAPELRQPVDRPRPQRRRLACDRGLARLFDARHSPIEGRDQFLEFPRELTRVHRHRCTPDTRARRRAAFHTSPQSPQRQYACSSRLRAVVEIELD
jgi:hypothetical protein